LPFLKRDTAGQALPERTMVLLNLIDRANTRLA
jgi:hypothetical protein